MLIPQVRRKDRRISIITDDISTKNGDAKLFTGYLSTKNADANTS
jgi:hypothetical protein